MLFNHACSHRDSGHRRRGSGRVVRQADQAPKVLFKTGNRPQIGVRKRGRIAADAMQ